ncbi:hypothetical protein [Streptomyces sp. NPDC046685]|uniref:hypothetical protein n=1 Tax=Streptomyces sp. NPDC046685 TaxID=3157202 RepID=UPI0033F00B0F
MRENSLPHRVDRCFNALEAAPVALGQVVYRVVLGRSAKGRESASYQADLAGLLRQAQNGQSDALEARDTFSLAAAHWALLGAVGVMLGMLLDYTLHVSFDLVVGISLTGCPAVSAASAADAGKSHRMSKRADAVKRARKGRGKRVVPRYAPIRNRWMLSVVAGVLLAAMWIMLFR